jgi:hypothetical protein
MVYAWVLTLLFIPKLAEARRTEPAAAEDVAST